MTRNAEVETVTHAQAKAAAGKAFSVARRTFHQLPTSVDVVRVTAGWGLLIGLQRDPGHLDTLKEIDGVPVEVNVIGSALLHG